MSRRNHRALGVIPAKAGIQLAFVASSKMDSRFRGNDAGIGFAAGPRGMEVGLT